MTVTAHDDDIDDDNPSPVPPSLLRAGVRPVWEAVRHRLETRGPDNRGRVRLPELDRDARLTLQALFERSPGATIDLAVLERSFRRLGVGADLSTALAALGVPVSAGSVERREHRRQREDARAAARASVSAWPVAWASDWIDEVVTAGLLRGRDHADAIGFVDAVRSVLGHLGLVPSDASDRDRVETVGGRPPSARDVPDRSPIARADLAARVLGDAHALDRGRTLEAATVRAIRHAIGDEMAGDDPWSAVGVHSDLVSGAALTWALPLMDIRPPRGARAAPTSGSLAEMIGSATALGVPLHVTAMALRRSTVAVAPGTVVVVAENPRVVEAAAERRLPIGVVCTNGNPSVTVRSLVEQLVGSGARALYHGDIDTPGLAISARMQRLGAVPWRMTAADYRAALAAADADGVVLPIEPVAPGPTPWDADLRDLFDAERRIVHEERVLDDLLDAAVDLAR